MDYGSLSAGIGDLQQAIELATESMAGDPGDLKKKNNLRILYNQLAFFYLEEQRHEAAMQVISTTIELGDQLQFKVPFNQEYSREQAYSYSTAGEVYQQLDQPQQALKYLALSMKMSETNLRIDPGDFSATNDLVIDCMLVGRLHQDLGQSDQAAALFHQAERLIRPVYKAEPNNKYYLHTLMVALLDNQKTAEARPLFEQL